MLRSLVGSEMCIRDSTYIRRRLIPYYDSGPLHKHQIYVRPILHFVPLVESGICLLVDVATLSTIYDVRHPLLLPPGYPAQELISRPQAVRHPSSTPTLAACVSFLHYSTLLSIIHIYHLNLHNTAHPPFPAFRPPSYKHLLPFFSPLRSTQPIRPSLHIT